MNGWILILGIAGFVLLWLVAQWLYFGPGEREFEAAVRECFKKQALKRSGSIDPARKTPTLTVPHKTANIEVSFLRTNDETYREHTFARFRIESLSDKKFKILLNAKEFFEKPLVFGERQTIADANFMEKYIIPANDGSFVTNILTPEIREKLLSENSLQVNFGRRTDAVRLSQDRGWLSVFTNGRTTDEKVFDALIDTAILFYDRLEEASKKSQRDSF